jgi:hypothetical protein
MPNLESPWLSADTETDDLTEGWGVRRVGWSLSDGTYGIFDTGNFPKVDVPVHFWNAKYDLPLLLSTPGTSTPGDGQLGLYVLRWFRRVGLKYRQSPPVRINQSPIKEILTYYDEVPILTKKGNPSYSGRPENRGSRRSSGRIPFSEALELTR